MGANGTTVPMETQQPSLNIPLSMDSRLMAMDSQQAPQSMVAPNMLPNLLLAINGLLSPTNPFPHPFMYPTGFSYPQSFSGGPPMYHHMSRPPTALNPFSDFVNPNDMQPNRTFFSLSLIAMNLIVEEMAVMAPMNELAVNQFQNAFQSEISRQQ